VTRRLPSLALPTVLLAVLGVASTAEAGGLYAAQRGVRPLGRGGAFVAGGDDLGAIAYNPAGIFDAGGQFLIDASLLLFSSDYTRQALLRQVDPNTGETVGTYEQTFPTVSGSAAPLPIPTVALSFAPHEDWRVAFGIFAPSAVLPSYPEQLDDGSPAPQRYQLISLDGSLLATVGAYAAWRPIPELTVGLGVELLAGSFTSRQTLSGCLPDRFFCAPEDTEWDIAAEIAAAPILAPTGIVGATYHFYEGWRVGASFHLPTWISSPATVRTRLPEAAPYRNAEQIGEDASLDFQLPWEVRLGLEARDLVDGLRVEVAGNLQYWAIHDSIDVVPDGIAITNLPGFPKEYLIPEIEIPRGFQTSIAGMIGAEYDIPVNETIHVTPRLGFSYETTAVPADFHSVLTLDSGKATPSLGVGVSVGAARFDAVYAHQFIQSVETDPAAARLRQIVPVQANVTETPDAINGGVYSWSIDILGVGFAYTFDPPLRDGASDGDPPVVTPPSAPPEAPPNDPPEAPP
jgi:long-chain fatty acid transport protein